MTYNLRLDTSSDGENAWPQRRETLVNQIRFYAPDVFGTQEGLQHQLQYMDETLKDYKFVGVGRADVKEKGAGEFSAVFYNTKKYKKLTEGTFWLSKTPDKPSRGWDASLNRICTYILLQDKVSGTKFYLFNTHFDHKGKEARKNSAELIIKKIKEINKSNLPFFLSGDFNLTPDEAPIQFISKELSDSKNVSQQPPFGPEGTFNGFKVCKAPKSRIDYIFVSKKNIIVKKYAVIANVKDLKYPSDHFPVLIEAEITQ
jgi:endonuclease/exonuclease/phosphatase family metal-dependent hydrolase